MRCKHNPIPGEEMPSAYKKLIRSHTELRVFQDAFDVSRKIFQKSKRFPKEETYSLTDQIRRSSRSISANIAEAWRKRRYELAFISKLSDAETEAAETQVWLQHAVECEYLSREDGRALYRELEAVIKSLVRMSDQSKSWVIK
jgi:four helix bundle protein